MWMNKSNLPCLYYLNVPSSTMDSRKCSILFFEQARAVNLPEHNPVFAFMSCMMEIYLCWTKFCTAPLKNLITSAIQCI